MLAELCWLYRVYFDLGHLLLCICVCIFEGSEACASVLSTILYEMTHMSLISFLGFETM